MDDRERLSQGDPLGEPARPTSGDPLGGAPAPEPPPAPLGAPERPGAYGGGPVPPGAMSGSPGFRPQRLGADAQFAEWWRRAVAAVIDGLVVAGITLLVLSVLGLGVFADGEVGVFDVILTLFVGSALFAFFAFIYAPLIMSRTNGQTPGKMITGCRVVRADGRPVDFLWAAAREVLVKGLLFGIAGSITGGIANLVDWLWPFVDGENRALHDFLVDSRVVKA